MPASLNPFLADSYGDHIVYVERQYRRSSARRATNDVSPFPAPLEMTGPTLFSRIEEEDSLACQRISTMRLRRFVEVAESTGKPEIVFFV